MPTRLAINATPLRARDSVAAMFSVRFRDCALGATMALIIDSPYVVAVSSYGWGDHGFVRTLVIAALLTPIAVVAGSFLTERILRQPLGDRILAAATAGCSLAVMTDLAILLGIVLS
jgi:hypothetical protein